MKIPVPRTFPGIGYGSASQWHGLCAGGANLFGDDTLGRHPFPVAGTLRKLGVLDCGDLPADVDVVIYKNGISTLLATTLTLGMGQAFDTTHSVAIAAGDYPQYRIVGTSAGFPGYNLGVCCEWESSHQVFGVVATGGTFYPDTALIAGALGNGAWSDYTLGSGPSVFSATYSVCGVYGSLTHLMLQRYALPSGGSFLGWFRINGIDQDGTGGTVDTRCLLDDSGAATALATFDLPIAPWDLCDVVVARQGTIAAFTGEHVAAGIAFRPTVGGQFMLCGGGNEVIPNTGTTWKWNHSLQEGATIGVHEAPVRTPFTTTAMYIKRGAPGVGTSTTHTLLRNGVAGALVGTLNGTDEEVVGLGRQSYVGGDTLTIQIDNSGTTNGSSRLHWALGAGPLGGVIGQLAWVHCGMREET